MADNGSEALAAGDSSEMEYIRLKVIGQVSQKIGDFMRRYLFGYCIKLDRNEFMLPEMDTFILGS